MGNALGIDRKRNEGLMARFNCGPPKPTIKSGFQPSSEISPTTQGVALGYLEAVPVALSTE